MRHHLGHSEWFCGAGIRTWVDGVRVLRPLPPGLAVFVDHRYGAWYRILRRDNGKYSDEKSPAGKCDYHTMGACHEVRELLLS